MEDTLLQPSSGVTWFFTGMLVLMILALALEEKLHAKKSIIVGLFAVVLLLLDGFLGLVPFGPITLPNGQSLELPVYISAIDWGVITIIVGSSVFVDATSRYGLFTWIAIKLTKLSRGDPLTLLWYYGLMTVVFSAVLNNVTAMIIMGSLSAVSLKRLERGNLLLGFLLIEGLLTNIGGLLTLISSVPNIIIGTVAGISFVEFFLRASPYVVVATLATIWLGARLFNINKLTDADEISAAEAHVAGFDENDGVESAGLFWFGAIMLVAFIVVIATTSVLPVVNELGMGFVAMLFALIMLLRYKNDVDQFYKAVDWDLIGFFMALFIVINMIEYAGVLDLIGEGITWIIGAEESRFGIGALLVLSALFSSVTDNIPLAAMLGKILAAQGTAGDSLLWWSVIFGANLGGNLTPIGSASTLVAVTIIHKHQLKLSFAGFVIKALPFAVMHIVLAAIYVLVFI